MTFLLPEHVRPAPFVPGNIVISVVISVVFIIIGIFLNVVFIITFGWVFSQRRQSSWQVWPLCAGTQSFRWIWISNPSGKSFVLRLDPSQGPSACKCFRSGNITSKATTETPPDIVIVTVMVTWRKSGAQRSISRGACTPSRSSVGTRRCAPAKRICIIDLRKKICLIKRRKKKPIKEKLTNLLLPLVVVLDHHQGELLLLEVQLGDLGPEEEPWKILNPQWMKVTVKKRSSWHQADKGESEEDDVVT